jgi:hypothetical protein
MGDRIELAAVLICCELTSLTASLNFGAGGRIFNSGTDGIAIGTSKLAATPTVTNPACKSREVENESAPRAPFASFTNAVSNISPPAYIDTSALYRVPIN